MSSASPTYLKPLYRWQEDVETLEAYSSGGFHPVKLDDEYCQSRYRVIHKLGFGHFSTVWLARDSAAHRYVALKIIEADASKRSSEVRMLSSVHQSNLHHPSRRFVSSLLENFSMSGPNGNHKCLVSEILGPTVSDVKESFVYDLLPLNIARRITAQLALGLSYIHSCGITHGDINIQNIAFKFSNHERWPVEEVYEHLGHPNKQVITRYDGNSLGPEVPPYAVSPALYQNSKVLAITNEISIFDFGEASFANKLKQRCTPILLSAPEALLGEPSGQPADMWAFACTVFELFNNESLFEGSNTDDVLSEIVDTLGLLPERWWKNWEYRWEFYEEDGRKKIENVYEMFQEVRPLALRMKRMRSTPPVLKQAEQLSEEDLAGLQKLLEGCFRYEPEERVTAEDVLKMDWIQNLCSSA